MPKAAVIALISTVSHFKSSPNNSHENIMEMKTGLRFFTHSKIAVERRFYYT